LAVSRWPLAISYKQKGMRNFRNYEIWQHAVDLAVSVSALCDGFPKYELFALGDQLRRASISISSNIAEGASRTSVAEFAHYLEISIGSAFEVETQLLIARKRNYITEESYEGLVKKLQYLERQINSFISRLRSENNNQKPKANR
jgi:four helix bundle protein